eukprot:CAMPEP_0174860210 /NCGR_PEP_ID=MMETSP1114-20130205/48542_1 /TAXON_ID=312471 /ORGANISM="Neobodo designis, Strain CCAP 1951/1" /LENGTH=49 /DNA_ID= /DNA_START= /DNA_END= /DNA_ORIENTATION=
MYVRRVATAGAGAAASASSTAAAAAPITSWEHALKLVASDNTPANQAAA